MVLPVRWIKRITSGAYFCQYKRRRIINMDRKTIIQNVMNNYGNYITKEELDNLIDSGLRQGFSYDLIYLGLKYSLSDVAGEEFYCTSEEVAKAFGMSDDEMNRTIEEAREELIANGENPDEYFKQVQPMNFMM